MLYSSISLFCSLHVLILAQLVSHPTCWCKEDQPSWLYLDHCWPSKFLPISCIIKRVMLSECLEFCIICSSQIKYQASYPFHVHHQSLKIFRRFFEIIFSCNRLRFMHFQEVSHLLEFAKLPFLAYIESVLHHTY